MYNFNTRCLLNKIIIMHLQGIDTCYFALMISNNRIHYNMYDSIITLQKKNEQLLNIIGLKVLPEPMYETHFMP